MPASISRRHVLRFMFLILFAFGGLAPAIAAAADKYEFDPAHTSVVFKIQHLGISMVQGRFNEFTGVCTVDAEDPAKSSFEMTIKTASVDTNVEKRDEHLRTPDFFDVKKFPEMTFKSTEVKKDDAGLVVTGDFTLHGVTKPVTFTLTGGQKAEFPKGTHRIGYVTEFKLKRSDFGMNTMLGPVGDEVQIYIGIEAVQK